MYTVGFPKMSTDHMSNSIWVLFELLIYLICILPLFTNISYRRDIGCWKISQLKLKQAYTLYVFYIIIFCVFDKADGDFFHYKEQVAYLYKSPGLATGLEEIYVWLISKVGFSYYLFRLVVWGSAVIILTRFLKHIQLNNTVTIWCFLLFALVNFSYARVSLGLIICFYGYILLYEKKHKLSTIYGLTLMLISLYFHKTIFILFFLCVLSTFVKISKKTIFIAIILFPVLVFLMNYYVSDIFYYLEEGSTEARYLSAENEGKGLAAKMLDYLRFIPIIIILLLYLKQLLKYPRLYPSYIERLFVLIVLILYLSSVLSFLNIGSAAISYRIRNMALLPVSILIGYYMNNHSLKGMQIIVLILSAISNIFYFLYMIYLKNLGLGI